MREVVVVQTGQCGNQIGYKFWESALKELRNFWTFSSSQKHQLDDSMSSLFRNIDSRTGEDMKRGADIACLRARAVLVDMEEGVVNRLLKSPIGELFDQPQYLTDVSGAGNNWAHGYGAYGPQYRESLLDIFQATAEKCDSLQSFFLLNSLGGGTGSGLGSYIVETLADHFPSVYRFSTCVFPSENDDVVTSPYNSVLSCSFLKEFSSCATPVSNDALAAIVRQLKGASAEDEAVRTVRSKRDTFDSMNGLVARYLVDLTASIRFNGPLNIDLNEITTNLVPYPSNNFLCASCAPLDSRRPRNAEDAFLQCLSPATQLGGIDPRKQMTYASAFISRGTPSTFELSDMTRSVDYIRRSGLLPRPRVLEDSFKLGMCHVAPGGYPEIKRAPSLGSSSSSAAEYPPYSLLCLNNTCGIQPLFSSMLERFNKLHSRKAHMHHYTEYVAETMLEEARESIRGLIDDYSPERCKAVDENQDVLNDMLENSVCNPGVTAAYKLWNERFGNESRFPSVII